VNPLRWAKAELLHLAWKQGRYTPPDRRLLEGVILPGLAAEAGCARVLSVGVSWYTRRYAEIFGKSAFVTIDLDGTHEPDVVGDLRDLETLFAEADAFDLILMNGVIGFGLNAKDPVDHALRACAARLRPGGTLLLGINEEKPTHVDPLSVPSHALFEARAFGEWPDGRVTIEVPFRERTHTFVFWRALPTRSRSGAA
jgi:SAM-dependent methyltransferase